MFYTRRRFTFKLPLVCFIAALIFCVSGCKNNGRLLLSTWASNHEEVFDAPELIPEELPSAEDLIWSGTVSHHLLVGDYIDDWFKVIAKNRSVKNFFIICPSHYGYSVYPWSVADVSWDCGEYGKIFSDKEKVRNIVKKLGVSQEPGVFVPEHGMNTLIPYVAKYFAGAKIVPIAVHGEPPLNQKQAQELCDALSGYFDEDGKKENFLVLSTDFAHHGNYEGTVFKDTRSRTFFNNPVNDTWVFCGCDNRPGVYTVAHLMSEKTKAVVQYHTNSFEVSGKDENDITSYFFSFFVN